MRVKREIWGYEKLVPTRVKDLHRGRHTASPLVRAGYVSIY